MNISGRRSVLRAIASAVVLLTAGGILTSQTSRAGAAQPTNTMNPPPATPVPEKVQIADGHFKPTWESLKTYKCPQWFRDAKLGFWAIQGPQSLPEAGDWYARHMYVEGRAQYKFHVEHFGHPSKFGYKDLAAAWKNEKLDTNRLASLYKKAGAKYLIVLANHHDNWDNWNSKYHRWNSVNLGPKKDIVGLWAASARKHGLRFGVTEHLGRSYSWFNTNKSADKKGPLAGVPYDGADPNFADLYFPPHPDTNASYPSNPPEWWPRTWFYRIRDLVDSYHPDLLYTDGSVPYGEVGRSCIAHFYNANTKYNGGKLQAVYNLKNWEGKSNHGDYVDGIGVEDVERGALKDIKAEPWQTDTCIGNWFYRTGMKYKSPQMVVCMLADIVSKNGNMLLNIPLKHDGTIDADEEKFLAEFGQWLTVNGEAIYATRPWKIFGEGPARVAKSHFNERSFAKMTARDIRFTTKGDTLYAIVLAWPADGKAVIRSLAGASRQTEVVTNIIKSVELVGGDGQLTFTQDTDSLTVTLPAKPGQGAFALRITGRGFLPMNTQPAAAAAAKNK